MNGSLIVGEAEESRTSDGRLVRDGLVGADDGVHGALQGAGECGLLVRDGHSGGGEPDVQDEVEGRLAGVVEGQRDLLAGRGGRGGQGGERLDGERRVRRRAARDEGSWRKVKVETSQSSVPLNNDGR